MYIKEKGILIAAVDHGFCTIKTPHEIFDNGVKELDAAPAFKENTILYKGKYYKIGEGRLSMKDTKTKDDDYFILTLAAIAKEMEYEGLHQIREVVIAAGLPFGRYSAEKQDFINYLKRGYVRFEYCGKQYDIIISDVRVYPQCYAAVANRLSNMASEHLIVDIGSKTIDVVHTKNHKPVETDCFTIPEALIAATRQVENAVYNQLNKRISEEQIQKVMMTGKCDLPERYTEICRQQLTAFAKRVEGQLKENGFDSEITPIIYCGGGARIMEEFGSIKGIHICYMEDVRANAIGYEFITKQMFGSR